MKLAITLGVLLVSGVTLLSAERGVSSDVASPVVYANADLPAIPDEGTPAASRPASPPSLSVPRPEAGRFLSYERYTDRDGHDRAWWQGRLLALRKQLAAARAELDRLNAIYAGRPGQDGAEGGYRYDPLNRPIDAHTLALAASAVARRDAVEAALDRLPDEARQAGALPGWLR